MLRWDDLRFLLSVARARSLAGAARELAVDQATVGRRIRALEASTRTRLFERTRAGLALSPAGEAVMATVEQVESAALAVERKLSGQDARAEGRVRLATSEGFAVWFIAPRLDELRRKHPGIELELVTGDAPVDLGRREADLSLRMSKPTAAAIVSRRVGTAGWALYASAAYLDARSVPDGRRQLADHRVVALGPALSKTAGARWMATRNRGTVVLTTNSLLVHAAAIRAGVGIGTLPCVCGDVDAALRRVPPGAIGQQELWLAVHPDVRASARVRAVMDHLGAIIARDAALLSGQQARRRRRSSS